MKKNKNVKKANIAVQKKEIQEFYLMLPQKTNVKELSANLSAPSEKIEIWTELDLMEIVLEKDSLLFQNAAEVFEDPEDLAFIEEHSFQTLYQVSWDKEDLALAKIPLKEIMAAVGGILCSDTDNFQPVFRAENIDDM